MFKVYDPEGNSFATTHDIAAAALLMSLYGDGSTIRFGVTNRIVWTEGVDGEGAESYDNVAEHINRVLHGVKA